MATDLRPADNKFHVGNGDDGKHYWITPPALYAELDAQTAGITADQTARRGRMKGANGIRGLSVLARSETSPENCYETPLDLVERIRTCLGGSIDLDPCTTALNPCGAERFYTPDDDGILQAWDAPTIYVNPPYGKTIARWVDKAATASQAGSKVILLVPARTSSAWFHDALVIATTTLFLRKRLYFGGMKGQAPFPNALIGFNADLSPLSDLGTLVRRLAA